MPWKTDDKGSIVVQDGHPVFIYNDGKESPFDADAALTNIQNLTTESMSRKTRLKDLETKYEPLKDIQDIPGYLSEASKAIETVKNFKDKEFIEANKVEALKKGVQDSYEAKIAELEKGYKKQIEEKDAMLGTKEAGIHRLIAREGLAKSAYLKNNTVLSPDIAFDVFGSQISYEESGKNYIPVVTKQNGERIFSLKQPGSYAGLDEALEILINEREDKNSILRSGSGGSGSQHNHGGGGAKSISRALFDQKSPTEKTAFITAGGQVTD